MQAIKALYKEGKIQLLSPLQGVTEAELFIIVLDKSEQAGGVAQSFLRAMDSSEQDFNAIGQAGFFETDEDNNVDWEDIFDVKPR
ncbi:MAG: hypothetical protein IPH35_20480 [Rhodoferax sp.]|nr:hypothetical protein [Rhodoferax sp.]